MAKKGPYRKVKRVEILKATTSRIVGEVCEMHPVLADRFIAANKAKITTEKLTNKVVIGGGKSKINSSE